jgi:hypothetical protein
VTGELELFRAASGIIPKLLNKGQKQGHAPASWLTEPIENHLLKSARHGITAQLMIDKLSPDPDHAGESARDHLERAAIRALMAVVVYDQQRID